MRPSHTQIDPSTPMPFELGQRNFQTRIASIDGKQCNAMLHVGDTFGERGMMNMTNKRTATVVCREVMPGD